MAQGKWKSVLLGIQGLIGHRKAPDWGFIYEISGNKAANWEIGDHVKLPDGREFVYSKSSGECSSGQAAEFVATGVQTYDVVLNSQVIGDKVITLTGGTHIALAKDVLRGAYVVTWPGALKDQTRGVIGNDVSDENADIKLYLDAPLTVALTAASTGVEVYENPYASLRTGSSASLAKAGVPAVYVSATGKYFWVQIAGFIFVPPQSDVINNNTGCYFRHDGSIEAEIATGSKNSGLNSTQYAGVRVIGNAADNGPLFLLK